MILILNEIAVLRQNLDYKIYIYVYIYKYIKADMFLLLMTDLQDPSPDTQMLTVFSISKAAQGRAMAPCMKHQSLGIISTLGAGIQHCQITKAAIYNYTGSLPLEEMESCAPLSFLGFVVIVVLFCLVLWFFVEFFGFFQKGAKFSLRVCGFAASPTFFTLPDDEGPDAV